MNTITPPRPAAHIIFDLLYPSKEPRSIFLILPSIERIGQAQEFGCVFVYSRHTRTLSLSLSFLNRQRSEPQQESSKTNSRKLPGY